MPGTWRDTMYVWDGILVADNKIKEEESSIPLGWEGTWVAREDAPDARTVEAPRRGAFEELVASDMHFQVKGRARLLPISGETTSKFRPVQASLAEGQGWDLADGESGEKKKHQDDEHDVLLANLMWSGDLRDQRNNLAFARGKNKHGAFVSAGWMRPGNRLTLARRYLQDDDVRAKWDLEELRKEVLEEIFAQKTMKVRMPPWKCDAFHSALMSSKKRARDEAKEGDDPKPEDGEPQAKK